MALRSRKPTSPGRRFQTVSDFAEITRDRPDARWSSPPEVRRPQQLRPQDLPPPRRRHKRAYRIIDFHRNKDGVPAKVASIEYDPNRNARIALLHYLDGEKRYILAPAGIKVGDLLQSGQGAEIRTGNALPLRYIRSARSSTTSSLRPGGGGKMGRGAGMSIQLVAKDGGFATLRLPSTEMRRVPIVAAAPSGSSATPRTELIKVGKAAATAGGHPPPDPWRGHDPVDHPLGGGEGRPPVVGTRSPRGGSPRAAP